MVVGATRGAADDFVRDIARRRSTFGVHRFSLVELAARATALAAAAAGKIAGTQTNAEAVAARVTFDAFAAGDLPYFGPVAGMPGFPKALARTVHELRLAGVDPHSMSRPGPFGTRRARPRRPGAQDLARLLARIDLQLDTAAVNDRAALFTMASAAWRDGLRWFQYPVLLLDVPLNSLAESRFAQAILENAPDGFVTCPAGDEATRTALANERTTIGQIEDDAAAATDLGRLRRYIFTLDPPPEAPRAGDVRLFSAPGEAREALEIARRVFDETARGVPFDQIAVCLRAPQHYLGLLEHAFERARIPVYFDRGTRRPDPTGRAFAALLSCACEKLSARRFDEYLSLGQVPRLGQQRAPVVAIVPDDEAYARFEDAAGIGRAEGRGG